MKKWLLVILALTLMVGPLMVAAEQLDLTAPKQPTAAALAIDVQYYQIFPPPNNTILINFNWVDATGNVIFSNVTAEITGQDFLDVMTFSIRSQDVGTGIGRGLKQLIWNKMEILYGVSFQ